MTVLCGAPGAYLVRLANGAEIVTCEHHVSQALGWLRSPMLLAFLGGAPEYGPMPHATVFQVTARHQEAQRCVAYSTGGNPLTAVRMWRREVGLYDRETVPGLAKHLQREVAELVAAVSVATQAPTTLSAPATPDVAGEIADIAILLDAICDHLAVHLPGAVYRKLVVLRTRDYSGRADDDGVIEHRRESEPC